MNLQQKAVALALLLVHPVFSYAGQSIEGKAHVAAVEKSSRVIVELQDGRQLRGRVVEACREHFVLQTANGYTELRYAEVRKLKVHKPLGPTLARTGETILLVILVFLSLGTLAPR